MTTIKKLKRLIQDLPDDMVVLVTASDHSFRTVDIQEEGAGYHAGSRNYSEWYGKEHASPGEKKIKALVIR